MKIVLPFVPDYVIMYSVLKFYFILLSMFSAGLVNNKLKVIKLSDKVLCHAISKMSRKLNDIIKKSNYNLQDQNVLKVSRRLDKIIVRYYNLKKCS